VSRWHLHAAQTNRNHPNHLAPWQNSITKNDIFFAALSASAIRHFPTKKSSPFFEQKKCIKQQALRQDSNKKNAILNVCGLTAKKQIVVNFLNSSIQHVSGHMRHGKTCSAPKMDTTVQAMFLFPAGQSGHLHRQGETL